MRIVQSVIFVLALSVCLLPMAHAQSISAAADQAISYSRDVRPILSNNCFQCHGFDPKTRESNLRLDTKEGATAELDSGDGRAIVPGDLKQSILLTRVLSHDSDQKMPPADSGKQITTAQIEILKKLSLIHI